MPSGAHGSSGGGSRGGGGSHSSFGRSRGGSSFYRRALRPRPFRFGRRVVILSTGTQNTISILAFFMAFIAMFVILVPAFTLPDTKNRINSVKAEHALYQNMAKEALNNPKLQREGEVKTWTYHNECNLYSITYKFKADDGSIVDNGYTFPVYTLETVPKDGSKIILAMAEENTDKMTDSIPLDFYNCSLEQNGNYISAKKSQRSSIIMLTIGLCAETVMIFIIVLKIAKSKSMEQYEAEQKNYNGNYNYNTSSLPQSNNIPPAPQICEYCGARVYQSDKICTQCGARIDTNN